MRNREVKFWKYTAWAACLVAGALQAQTIMTCSSNNNSRQFCAADTRGGVRLVKQISGSPCVQGRTWSYTRSGIWVDRGCRAQFAIGGAAVLPVNPYPPQGSGSEIVSCSSDDGKRNFCKSRYNGKVRLVRQRSDSPCTRNYSWGTVRGGGIWVDRGCRADFEVRGY